MAITTSQVHNSSTCAICRGKAEYRRRHPEIDWRRITRDDQDQDHHVRA